MTTDDGRTTTRRPPQKRLGPMGGRPSSAVGRQQRGTLPFAVLLALAALLVAGCASSGRPFGLGPVKAFDPDTLAIPEPEDKPENELWDRLDMTVIHQLEKPLDLNWTGRQIGRAVGLAGARQADNINALDEPPNSSWYRRRHFYERMTPAELARGPNTVPGPDTSAAWTVVSGKFEGAAPGFVIKDARGDRYLLKFDGPDFPEMGSAAEVISTKILYAAGYHVPENYVAYFDPERLVVGEEAEIEERGLRRPMTDADVERLLETRPRTNAGAVRALASRYVKGRPVGIWEFEGTREDDPNDRVWHQHRRELRGLRVIGSWINDADRRAANTLAVYTSGRYIRHYLLDMGGTLGSKGANAKSPLHGYEYLFDPLEIAKSAATLGLYNRPWLFIERDAAIAYPSVGYFEADLFDPGDWVPTHPNPAFEKMTLRDAFWGAKIVMSFSDDDLEALVATGRLTNPAAERYLLETLKARRDKIGRYWFGRVNPLDRFRVGTVEEAVIAASGSAPEAAETHALRFDDLAVTGGLEPPGAARYEYALYHNGKRLTEGATRETALPLTLPGGEAPGAYLDRVGAEAPQERALRVRLRTRRADGRTPGKPLDVYVLFPAGGAAPRVAGLDRRE